MRHRLGVFLLALGLSFGACAGEVQLRHDGLRLNANLEKVDGNWPAGPVVLMVHGTLAYGGMEIMKGLQGMFRDRGISSLAIDLSYGLDDRHGMYDCATPHAHRNVDAVNEIGVWADWLKGEGAEQLVLLGHSRGANQVPWYALEHPDPGFVLVALLAPAMWDKPSLASGYQETYGKDLGPLLEQARAMVARGRGASSMEHVDFLYCKDTTATAETFLSYYEPDQRMDTLGVIPRLKAPVVVFAGTEDTVVPDLASKIEPLADGDRVRLVTLEGADHFFRDLYSEDIADIVTELLGN